jgi:hypothetical protein
MVTQEAHLSAATLVLLEATMQQVLLLLVAQSLRWQASLRQLWQV